MPATPADGIRALTADQLRRVRLRANGLEPRRAAGDGVAAVVAASGGLQAQQWSAALLSVRARSHGVTAGDVERAREVDRSVMRGWFMRGTLHLVPTADAGWLLALYAPVTIAGARRRHAQLGLDAATLERGTGAIRAAVAAHGPRTRAELVEELLRRDVRIDPRSQAVPHLIAYACLTGVICHGPHRDGEPAFALLSEWVPAPPSLDPDAALDELARRHLAAFGPATVEDFAAWSGLPKSRVRAAWRRIGAELTEVRAGGTDGWMLTSRLGALEDSGRPAGVRLLPAFDTYLLGYASRSLVVAPADARRVWPGGGIIHPTVLVDGQAAATWRYDTSRRTPRVRVTPFTGTALPHGPLEAEAADVGRFLGTDPTVTLEGPARG